MFLINFLACTILLKDFDVVACMSFFSSNSQYDFYNELVEVFLPVNISAVPFQFLGQYACIDHWCLLSVHHMVCNIRDPDLP
jgi:hypothetical protein